MEDMKPYLLTSEIFDFDNEIVKEKALEITHSSKNTAEKASDLFYWVRNEIKYDMKTYLPYDKTNFMASETLKRKQGFCVSKAVLLSTFARAVNIPARIHLVDLINHKISQKVIDFMETNVMFYHGFSEMFLNNHWVKLTPSFDPDTAIKAGFIPMVEFDGEHDAVFPKFDNEGNKYGEYVLDRGVHADLPLDEIDAVFEENYPKYAILKQMLQKRRKKAN